MFIKSSKFLKSFTSWKDMPADRRPEFAFIGRSNVGKSSLINMLCNRKELAKTSSVPGKTQLINRFLINDAWCIVDLPGYGFAKVNSKKKARFSEMIAEYLLNREQLLQVMVLVDLRIPPQAIDQEFMQWCGENEIPFMIVFTKADEHQKAALHQNGWEELPPMMVTSSRKRSGKDELIAHLNEVMQQA
jgi:GTP-binding protein